MTQVVALRTRRRQDGRIRDRRDVIAVNRAGKGRACGHEEQRIGGVEHADDDGQDERNGSPRRAHREADERRDEEDNGGQEVEAHPSPFKKLETNSPVPRR